ncbi:MAG TPA: APC family permease, partial [Gemmatimonadaceae bacterium]|nr:APC family permease [Gemmatimonadaceae bacterium]
GWIDWISTCASTAAIAIVIGESIVAVTALNALAAAPIAMSIVAIFTLLLIRGTKLGDHAQRVTSLAKALALLALVVACFVFAGRARVIPPATPATPATPVAGSAAPNSFVALLLAVQAVIYAYDGWSGPIYFSEELADPGRQIPRSMFYGLLGVAVIYLSINGAFARAVPTSAIAGSPLAAATVAQALFGHRGELLVRLVVIVSLPSAVNACLLMASRVLFAISRDGLGVAAATRVNVGGTPIIALVASGVVSLAFLATGTFNSIIAIAAFFFVANYTLAFITVFVLRRREPTARRPYRAIGHPVTTACVLIGSLGFLVSAVLADTTNSIRALAIVVISYPVFRWARPAAVTAASTVE